MVFVPYLYWLSATVYCSSAASRKALSEFQGLIGDFDVVVVGGDLLDHRELRLSHLFLRLLFIASAILIAFL